MIEYKMYVSSVHALILSESRGSKRALLIIQSRLDRHTDEDLARHHYGQRSRTTWREQGRRGTGQGQRQGERV